MYRDSRKPFEDELFGVGIDASVAQGEIRLLGNIARALRRGLAWIAGAGVIGGTLGLIMSFTTEVRYTSVAQVMIETRVSEDTQFTPFVSGLPTSLTSLESELEVLRSLDLVDRVVDRLNLQDDTEFFDPTAVEEPPEGEVSPELQAEARREAVIGSVAERRSIEQVGNISAVYAISFTSADPEKAAVLANALAEEYVSTTRTAKLRSLELAQGWLTERVNQLQADLTGLGVQREQHVLSAPYSPDEIETIKASNVAGERRLQPLQKEMAEVRTTLARVRGLMQQDRMLLAAILVRNPSPALAEAIAAFRQDNAAGGPALEAEIAREIDRLESRRSALLVEIEPLADEVEHTRAVLVDQARRDAETRRIENNIAVSEAIYQDFMSQLSRRTEQDAYLEADARVIARARPPQDPSEPNRRFDAAVGMLAAALAVTLFIIGREALQHRMRNVREFEIGTGLPMIGVVPEVAPGRAPLATFVGAEPGVSPDILRFARKIRWSVLSELPGGLAAILATPGAGDETTSRRKSRNMIQARGAAEPALAAGPGGYGTGAANGPHTVIAGASANYGDGQSSSMLALACAFADAGDRVLLVDCDFEASPYKALRDDAGINLGQVRSDPRRAKQLVVETGFGALHILPAPSPDEKIEVVEWLRLFRNLAAQYDCILLDTPPLMTRIDTTVLQKAADMVILFTRWNATTTGETRSIMKLLGDVGVTPIGVVGTRIELDRVGKFGDDVLFYFGRSMSA
jgi:uncharacterized protein involved in exopolysaccharide biosynthesis/Mrp family chromosome partitioning ATPase